MKFGFRTPSYKRSLSAMTRGALTRAIKKSMLPGYGQKGKSYYTSFSKSAYNKVYNLTTVSVFDLFKTERQNKSIDKSIREEDVNLDCRISDFISTWEPTTFKKGWLLMFIVVFVSIFLFFDFYVKNDWWMFFCCLFSYSIQFLCMICMVGDKKTIRITNDNLQYYKHQEHIFQKIYTILCVVAMLLDAFPFVAMLKVNLTWIIPHYSRYFGGHFYWFEIPQYEGGFLVFLLTFVIWYLWGYSLYTVHTDMKKVLFIKTKKEEIEKSLKEIDRLDQEIRKLEDQDYDE